MSSDRKVIYTVDIYGMQRKQFNSNIQCQLLFGRLTEKFIDRCMQLGISIYCVYNASVYQNKGNRTLVRYCAINTRCLGVFFG